MSTHAESHEGHGSHDAAKSSGDKSFMVDKFFNRIGDYISESISKLVAFVLFVATIGAVFGYLVAVRQLNPLWIAAPAILGIIAYYERDVAALLFVLMVAIVIL